MSINIKEAPHTVCGRSSKLHRKHALINTKLHCKHALINMKTAERGRGKQAFNSQESESEPTDAVSSDRRALEASVVGETKPSSKKHVA